MAPLPDSVEQLLELIRVEKSTEPADQLARRELASIGEDQALDILGRISRSPAIKTTLSRFVMYMIKKYCTKPRTPERRRPEPAYSQESVNFSGPQKSLSFAGNRDDPCAVPIISGMPLNEAPPWQPACTTTPPPHRACTTPPRQPASPMPLTPLACTTPLRQPASNVPQWQQACTTPPRQPASTTPQLQPTSTTPPRPSPFTVPPRQQHTTVPSGQPPINVLEALGEFEFRKAFLILSYIGREKVDDIISVDSIMKLKWLPMAIFERNLWDIVKNKGCISESDRRKNLDWDSKKTYIYHCHVDHNGSFTFKGPYLQDTTTHLHRVLGDDNVLIVKFAAEGDRSDYIPLYHRIAEEGITLGLRRYHFFVFKDGGKEEKKSSTSSSVKCYFVCMESKWAMDVNKEYILCNKSIQEARGIFMHAHTLSSVEKYMARFSLILSKTIKLGVDLASVNIEQIDDMPCLDEDGQNVHNEDGELMIHTDGTGFISEDLANRCPQRILKGHYLVTPREFQKILDGFEDTDIHSSVKQLPHVEPPLLTQFRLFYNGIAVKGTLLVDKRLPPETIQIRPSMIKVEADPESLSISHCNSLEIVGTSNLYRTRLSKSIIALLHYGGVPEEYFLELAMNAILEAQDARLNRKSAARVAFSHGNLDGLLVARMILCGIPLHEPYLEHQLSLMMRQEWNGLKAGKIRMSDCYSLMGTADPTGSLEPNNVCIILDNGQISGKVLVYKHPGLHFGDIHVLNSVYVKDIEKIVGNAKYAIFFPTKGRRSLADEMANSDYDGDLYWVSRNPQLLEYFKPGNPWKWSSPSPKKTQVKKPTDFSGTDLERALFQKFLDNRFNPSYTMSEASDCWMSYMDRILTTCVSDTEKQRLYKKIIELVDIYYRALDAPKKGSKVGVPDHLKPEKYPHYLERSKKSFHSMSVLGKIYDKVNSFQVEEPPVDVQLLPCLSEQAPEHCLNLWSERYKEYRKDMSLAMELKDEKLKNSTADQVIQKYKLMLYEAEEFKESPRSQRDVLDEALAIYQIVYNDVSSRKKKVSSLGFAWKVAGDALSKLYANKQNEDSTFICLKSVLKEIL